MNKQTNKQKNKPSATENTTTYTYLKCNLKCYLDGRSQYKNNKHSGGNMHNWSRRNNYN